MLSGSRERNRSVAPGRGWRNKEGSKGQALLLIQCQELQGEAA